MLFVIDPPVNHAGLPCPWEAHMGKLGISFLPILIAVLLVGCSDSGSPPLRPLAENPTSAVSSVPDVSGPPGARPQVDLTGEAPKDSFAVREVRAGKGAAVTSQDVVTVRYTAFNWTTRRPLASSFDAGSRPLLYKPETMADPALQKGVVDQRVGARVLVIAPAAFAASVIDKGADMFEHTVVLVLDIDSVTPWDATLSGPTKKTSPALPSVQDSGKAPVSIKIPETKPPTKLTATTMINGKGPALEAGQSIALHYTGITWETELYLGSSWRSGGAKVVELSPESAGLRELANLLTRERVGSRVQFVIPPSTDLGGDIVGAVPSNSTLILVIDILHAV
ncbi:hypothetical protein ACFZAV_43315 [Streptomyces sp. NPDC008343]|uniref:FKBP-type peptidyl-prolyl cis-trans isomerase n=1 Tax=Streptomyces sp. NPDC008343 TaxID=3364828 RepID=UPI0036E7F612